MMGMNSQIHFYVSKEDHVKLKQKAKEEKLDLSEYCRRKVIDSENPFTKMDNKLTLIINVLNQRLRKK